MSCMDKSDVYSWRLSSALKDELQAAARAENSSMSKLLDRLARDWLKTRKPSSSAADQKRRRAALIAILKSVEEHDGGGPPTRSATNANIRNAFKLRAAAKDQARKVQRRAR